MNLYHIKETLFLPCNAIQEHIDTTAGGYLDSYLREADTIECDGNPPSQEKTYKWPLTKPCFFGRFRENQAHMF